MLFVSSSNMNKINIILLFSFASLLLLTLVSADETILLCLTDGQSIEFSECNPNMNDFDCTSTSCQICVKQLTNGVYCPASLNACNNLEIEGCEPLIEDIDDIVDDNSEGDDDGNDLVIILNLVSPSDNYVSDVDLEVDFSYSVTESSLVGECSLYLDNVLSASSVDIQEGENIISYVPWEGSYSWEIKCETIDGAAMINSGTRILTISSDNNDNANTNSNDDSDSNTNDNSNSGSSSSSGGYSFSYSNSGSSNSNPVSSNNLGDDGVIRLGSSKEEVEEYNEEIEEVEKEYSSITGYVIEGDNKSTLFVLFLMIILIVTKTTYHFQNKD